MSSQGKISIHEGVVWTMNWSEKAFSALKLPEVEDGVEVFWEALFFSFLSFLFFLFFSFLFFSFLFFFFSFLSFFFSFLFFSLFFLSEFFSFFFLISITQKGTTNQNTIFSTPKRTPLKRRRMNSVGLLQKPFKSPVFDLFLFLWICFFFFVFIHIFFRFHFIYSYFWLFSKVKQGTSMPQTPTPLRRKRAVSDLSDELKRCEAMQKHVSEVWFSLLISKLVLKNLFPTILCFFLPFSPLLPPPPLISFVLQNEMKNLCERTTQWKEAAQESLLKLQRFTDDFSLGALVDHYQIPHSLVGFDASSESFFWAWSLSSAFFPFVQTRSNVQEDGALYPLKRN